MCDICESYTDWDKVNKEKAPVFSHIMVEPIIGHIEDCINEAIAYAKSNKDSHTLSLRFNGVDLPVKSYMEDSTVIEVRRLTDIYDDYKKQRLVESFE